MTFLGFILLLVLIVPAIILIDTIEAIKYIIDKIKKKKNNDLK